MSGSLRIPGLEPTPTGELVVAYGGGVNTIALLTWLHMHDERPRAIVMSDPGDEWPESIAYRDEIIQPWLASIAWPPVTVISVASEAPYRPRARGTVHGTLRDECLRIHALPSIAYGWKKCSQKYKARPFAWWCERQSWALEAWERGERIVRVIGYDADEPERAHAAFMDEAEAKRYVPRYPLIDAGIGREHCEALIVGSGKPLPHKSACTYCPPNQVEEWRELRAMHPDRFADALAMEENAKIDVPDVVGLMRVMPKGRRQLRTWVGDEQASGETEATMPCECST